MYFRLCNHIYSTSKSLKKYIYTVIWRYKLYWFVLEDAFYISIKSNVGYNLELRNYVSVKKVWRQKRMSWSLLYEILTSTDLDNFVIATICFLRNIVKRIKHFGSKIGTFYWLLANTLTIMSFYSMWYIMLSDIHQLEQTNNKNVLYNNLTMHPTWVCLIDSMSLSHLF